MVATKIDEGGTLELVATTARTSGDVVIYGGDTIGIVGDTVAIAEEYRAHTLGKFELPKINSLPFTPGEDVYWDTTNVELTTVGTGNTRMGVVARAATTTSTRGRVDLNATNVQMTPQT